MLKVVHIHRTAETAGGTPRYDIIEPARRRDAPGSPETASSLTQPQTADWLTRQGVSFAAVERILSELSATGTAEVTLPPRIGPRIVRAWFDTVLNPLIEYVESERALLENNNWTYSFAARTLELIQPLRQSFYNANLEQILQMNEPLSTAIEAHDVAVQPLGDAVDALHNTLTASPDFIQLCDSLLASDKLSALGIRELGDIFGAYPPPARYSLIAQYVVNGTGELPPHYSTARFWNENRDRLLECLVGIPHVRELFESAVSLASKLTIANGNLGTLLKSLRQDLSLQYDVPIISTNRKRTA